MISKGIWQAATHFFKPYFLKGLTSKHRFVVIALTVSLLLLSFKALVASEGQTSFYVSPDGTGETCQQTQPCTLETARIEARKVASVMTHDLVISLAPGTYRLDKTFTLDGQDSGQNGYKIIYKAATKQPTILSGGAIMTGWTTDQNGMAIAPLADKPIPRRLYVNNQPAVMAQEPNEGQYFYLKSWDESAHTLVAHNQDIGGFTDLQGPEVANMEIVVHRHWNADHLRIGQILGAKGIDLPPGTATDSATDSTGVVNVAQDKMAYSSSDYSLTYVVSQANDGDAGITLQSPESENAFALPYPPREAHQAYHLKNDRAFLDASGEFYCDPQQQTISYVLREGEKVDDLQAEVPLLEKIMTVQGTADLPAHHLQFIGLTFALADWLEPANKGFVGIQAGTGNNITVPAGVEVTHAHHIVFDQDTFENMTASGLNFYEDVQDGTVTHSTFQNLGGQGLALDATPKNDSETANNIRMTVSNNTFTRLGQVYLGSVGLFAGYVANVTLDHNHLFDLPYTGISVGWGWSKNETRIHDNLIQNNDIHQVMQLLDDGAGIYTLSNQPGTVIEGNYIHDLTRSTAAQDNAIAGIYLDEGSSNITVQNNILENVPQYYNFNLNGPNNVVR